jgi:drug/metabolite transporter (DMT)-like permease
MLLAMVAFAGNSIIARFALADLSLGPWAFSTIRLLAGATVLTLMVGPRRILDTSRTRLRGDAGGWAGAVCLTTYVVFFSYAYRWLDAGTGALVLFATVQIVMIGSGIVAGERLAMKQWTGAGIAIVGLVVLLRPGVVNAPNLTGVMMMGLSGLGWAMYSLIGRRVQSPTLATAGNFVRAAALVLLIGLPVTVLFPERLPSSQGVALAILSGAVTSGLGYVLWYRVLPHLAATQAGIAQLSVPAIAAIGGIIFLNETPTTGLVIATTMVLGGVGVATLSSRSSFVKS